MTISQNSKHLKASAFERVTAAVIVGNTGLLLSGLVVTGHEAAFELAHSSCLVFFLLEIAVRIRREGWRFFRGGWNVFDTLIIVASCLPALGVDTAVLRLARMARLVHLTRHVSHMLMVQFVQRVDPVLLAGVMLATGCALAGATLLGAA